MSRSGGQTEAKLPVYSPQLILVLIYRPTVGMKGLIDLSHAEDRTADLWWGSPIRYHSAAVFYPLSGPIPQILRKGSVRENHTTI
ncbi:hypothetical protein TNCV_728531 [Trichonephila clavipes]|nr:hypothetical protein TNCV_728531 [Trichonephila clavipes]